MRSVNRLQETGTVALHHHLFARPRVSRSLEGVGERMRRTRGGAHTLFASHEATVHIRTGSKYDTDNLGQQETERYLISSGLLQVAPNTTLVLGT